MNSQNAVIACECRAIALPRILFKFLSPNTTLANNTAGVNGPNLDTLPIVHFASGGRRVVRIARRAEMKECCVAGRIGAALMKAVCISYLRRLNRHLRSFQLPVSYASVSKEKRHFLKRVDADVQKEQLVRFSSRMRMHRHIKVCLARNGRFLQNNAHGRSMLEIFIKIPYVNEFGYIR